jgi:hypothetical protein
MKKIILVFLVSIFVTFVYGQTKTEVKTTDLKKEITSNIAKDYAGFKIDKAFKVDNAGVINYQVNISQERAKITLIYDKDGKFLNKIVPPRRSVVKNEDLKKDIKDNIAKDYKGYTISKAIQSDDNGVVTYHISILKDNERVNLVYDKDGKFLKKIEPRKIDAQKKGNTKKVEPQKEEIKK